MRIRKVKSWLIVAVCLSVACVLQVIGLARYVGRLPDDWVGIGLYSATFVGFAFAAGGGFLFSGKRSSAKKSIKNFRIQYSG